MTSCLKFDFNILRILISILGRKNSEKLPNNGFWMGLEPASYDFWSYIPNSEQSGAAQKLDIIPT